MVSQSFSLDTLHILLQSTIVDFSFVSAIKYSYWQGITPFVLQVLAIEFVTFAIKFVLLGNEFINLAIEFVRLAIEVVPLAIEFVTLA